ncbi:MAG: hypothetical protein LYZ66_04890 [Nitrososphaerales archaeon]|nr:hypothetical protein [Nitrososphaerales archaeon]
MTLQDFYDFERRGVVKSKVSKTRVFFFSAKSWQNIEAQLFKTFSTGASVMLEEMGRSYGIHVAKEAKLTYSQTSKVLETLQSLAAASGWGDVELSGDLAAGTSLEMAFKDCIFCADGVRADSASCHFLVGLAAGIADELYGSSHSAAETACIRAAGKACVFAVKKD